MIYIVLNGTKMTRSVAKELGVSIQFLGDFPDIFQLT